jgi:hypothetical protein
MVTMTKNDAKIENRGTLTQTNNEKIDKKEKEKIYYS